MIEIKDLNKYFNKRKKNEIHVINNTSLTLPDNGLVALLGESGCGKTTMLNAIGGLDKVNSGSIFINGNKITGKPSFTVDKIRNLSVGYIFQDYKLIDDMTVFDNVAIALRMVGIKDKDEIKERVEYVLDKVGILRYRYRPANTLSGGERQRVGIARALVKNPDIILADEPTGNLDSKNSVEIMNIIKTISKNRLVILVTHERKLAEFYSSRIIELVDGQVVNDYENIHDNALDYEIDNVFYLKDFEKQDHLAESGNEVNIYGDNDTKIKVNLIVRNGNIYIQSTDNLNVEVVDDSSAIEVIDDHKIATTRDSIEDYEFNMDEVGNQNIKKRYTSISNPFKILVQSFNKVNHFPVVKKLLLIGFILTGFFIMFGVARIDTVTKIVETDFIKYNKSYIHIDKPGMKVDQYEALKDIPNVEYVLPSNSKVSLITKLDDYYQTHHAQTYIQGSIASVDLVTSDKMINGAYPKNNNEFIIDKIVAKDVLSIEPVKMSGVLSYDDLIGRTFKLNNNISYTLVGICDTGSPSIYMYESELYQAIKYSFAGNDDQMQYMWDMDYSQSQTPQANELTNYEIYKDELTLVKGAWPENDYEVIVNNEYKDNPDYKIGKELKQKVNDTKLKVVGYYTSAPKNYTYTFSNAKTVEYSQILSSKKFTVCVSDAQSKSEIVNMLKEKGFSAEDSFEKSKNDYLEKRNETVKQTVLLTGVIMLISLVEMYLISRSSFLSRIKEVGTLRAIGVKKSDIYKMFSGEVFVITSLTCLPAILLTYYVIDLLGSEVSLIARAVSVNPSLLLIAILIAYVSNFIFGLLPVALTMRKTPAQILARYDVD